MLPGLRSWPLQPAAGSFARLICSACCRYVQQTDIHSPQLTIRESLKFSAECRLLIDDQSQLEEFVDEVGMLGTLLQAHAPAMPARAHSG